MHTHHASVPRTTAPAAGSTKGCATSAQAGRASTPRRLGVYAQDLVQITAPLEAAGRGLRYDYFRGSYQTPADGGVSTDGAASAPSRLTAGASEGLWSKPLRRAVPAQRHACPTTCLTARRSTPRATPTSTTLPGSNTAARSQPQHRARRQAGTGSGRPPEHARVALFHTTKYNERNRDSPAGSTLPIDRLPVVRTTPRRGHRHRHRRPHHAAVGGVRLLRLDTGRPRIDAGQCRRPAPP